MWIVPFNDVAQSVMAGLHSPTMVHKLALDVERYDFILQIDWIRSDWLIAASPLEKMV